MSIMLPPDSRGNNRAPGWRADDLRPDEISATVLRRFLEGFTPGSDDECWLWQGARQSTGYGAVNVDTLYLAHRLSGVLFSDSPLEHGLTIDHLCFVKLCVNPNHLEPVTLAENLRRARAHYGYTERPGPPEAKWTCPECGTVTRNDGIRRHQRRTHGRPATPKMRAA